VSDESTVIKVTGESAAQNYDVVVGRGLLGSLPGLLGERVRRVLVIHPRALRLTGDTVRDELAAAGFTSLTAEIPDAEEGKHIQVAAFCWQVLGQNDFTRSDAIVAVGGGWKDAPKEGFDLVKFFRSPLMTMAWALLLSRFTDSSLLIAVGAIGFERATAETYKTFFFPSRPRGKFSGKPVTHPEMLRRRIYFVPVYLTIWVLVVALGALALGGRATPLAGAGL